MSTLPAAKKQISANPAKGSVTAPIQPDLKDRDIERKIKMYGVIDALRHGKLPSNAQIDSFLSSLLTRSPTIAGTTAAPVTPNAVPPSPSTIASLSSGGKQLTQDLKAVVETLRALVAAKNGDERVQALIARLRAVRTEDLKVQINSTPENTVPSVDKVVQGRDQALKHLRTLLSFLLTNVEARKLLTDFSLLGRDLLARGAVHAAEIIRPDDERLADVDQSAPADAFINPNEVSGPTSDALPESFNAISDNVAQRVHAGDLPGAKVALQGTTQGLTDDTQTRVGETVGQLKGDVIEEQEELGEAEREGDEVKVEEKKRGMKERMRALRGNVKGSLADRVPDKHKDLARDKVERGKQFLSEEYLPKDRRDQFIYRGKKVIMECQKHDDYQDSVTWLLAFIEEYARHGRNAAGTGKNYVGGITDDPTISQCVEDIRVVLERFADGKNLNIIVEAVDAMIDDARRDEELKGWWQSVDAYVRKVLLEPGYVIEPDCSRQGKILRENGRQFFDEKYKEHFDNLFSSVGEWAKGWKEDPINKKFGKDWAKLAKDLVFNNEGELTFKRELWDDVRSVLLPAFIERMSLVGYIPIPRIEYTDDSLDLVVENLTLEGRNLFPNIIGVESHNHFRFSPYGAIVRDIKHGRKAHDEETHRVRITLEQMQADMRDVRFVYRKKTGVVRMRDEGVADVILGGSGLTITIDLATSPSSPSLLAAPKVNVSIDSLKFAIRDSNHDFLYKTLKPLATRLVKRQLEKAVGEAVALAVGVVEEGVGRVLAGLSNMAGAAKAQSSADRNGEVSPASAGGAVAANAPASPTRAPPGPATARVASIASSENKKNSQFKVVTDPNQSLLVGEGHKEGWGNKISEAKTVARGAGTLDETSWRSEAFTLK